MPIRVVIADDHVMVRENLREMLKAQGDIDVIGEANDGIEAVEMARVLRPDILLLDIAMPRMDGIEAAIRVRHEVRETRIVLLSMLQPEAYVPRARQAGVHGYVMKGSPTRDLLHTIRAVHAGEFPP